MPLTCISTFIASGQVLPGTTATSAAESAPLSDAQLAEASVVVDPYFPRYEEAARWLDGLRGNASEFEAQCRRGSRGCGSGKGIRLHQQHSQQGEHHEPPVLRQGWAQYSQGDGTRGVRREGMLHHVSATETPVPTT